jgi:hypothetical protein
MISVEFTMLQPWVPSNDGFTEAFRGETHCLPRLKDGEMQGEIERDTGLLVHLRNLASLTRSRRDA